VTSPHEDILAVLREHLSTAYSIPGGQVSPEARLQDLGLDSLDVVEITATLMEVAGGPGPLAALTEAQTVSGLLAIVTATRTRE
jgi:acyl carrier protein